MVRLIIGLLVFSFSGAALGETQNYTLTGSDLLSRCDGPYANDVEKIAHTNFCQGYLQGLQQMHHVVIGFHKAAPLYCEPTTTGSYNQLQRLVVKWLKNNPEELHRDARVLVTRALMDGFPCR